MYCKVSDSELDFLGHIAWIYIIDKKKAIEENFYGLCPRVGLQAGVQESGLELKIYLVFFSIDL